MLVGESAGLCLPPQVILPLRLWASGAISNDTPACLLLLSFSSCKWGLESSQKARYFGLWVLAEDPVLRKSWDVAVRLVICSLHLVAEFILCPRVHSWCWAIRAWARESSSLQPCCPSGRGLFFPWMPWRQTRFWMPGGVLTGCFRKAQLCWAGPSVPWF